MASSDRFRRVRVILEVVSNVAIVIAVVVGVSVWLRHPHIANFLLRADSAPAASENSAVGTRIDMPGVDWSTHPETLVLAISSACHFCIQSTPFYSKITRSSHVAPIIVAMPQDMGTAQRFLRQHAITPSSTVSIPLTSLQVQGTPTLLLVSSTGRITRSWVGELSNSQQKQVLESLDHS